VNPVVIFTEAENKALHDLFPSRTPVAEIARQMGRSEQAIYARARKMKLRRPTHKGPGRLNGAMTLEVIRMAARPNGVGSKDLPYTVRQLSGRFNRLVKEGHLFPAHCGWRNTRYFTTKEAAAAAEALVPPKVEPWGVSIKAGPRGPAYQPGEPIRTKQTKFTRCPSPPERVLYSNTFPRY
jgi:hypothetical protein